MVREGEGTAAVADAGLPIYRCEGIEIDCSLGCLKRGGQEQHLRQQSFHVLLYLLERRQRLVTREELIEAFWPGVAVTDNAVAQCIAEIRKALEDHPRNPRFVKTIPKVGYRFIASVAAVLPQPEAARPALDETPHRDRLSGLPHPPRGNYPSPLSFWWLRAVILALLLAAAFAAWAMWRRAAPQSVELSLPRVAGRKALAIMFFENQSSRPDLSWLSEGLTDMFIADLAHFDRLTVLPRPQLQLLLNRTGHRSDHAIQLDDALEISRRTHADAVLLGSFMAWGEKTLINVRLFETSRGKLLAADRFIVDRPADIMTQVDLLSPKLAGQLGATVGTARAGGLAEVMTDNVEAYRYYSSGVSKAQAFQNGEAIALLRKAIQLDPSFAMAYARIGYAYSVTDFLPEKGLPFLAKAMRLSEHLTAKDRLYVTAWDAIARKDYSKGIRTLQQIVGNYPLEMEAYARLARLLHSEERPQEAIAIIQRGLAIDPADGDLYNALGICFLGLRRYDEAVAAHQRYAELAPHESNAHDSLGMSLQQSGRYENAVAEYDAALSIDPEFQPSIIHLGDLYAQQGRYHDAIRQYERYIAITSSDAARAVGYGSIAQVQRRRGDFVRAELAARNELRFAKGAVWNSLLAALDRGDSAKASHLEKRLFENVPYPMRGSRNELRSYHFYLGTLALRDNRPSEAVTHFQEALRHLPASSGLDLHEDCLADSYLRLGRLDEAIDEYHRILRPNPNDALAQFHLAQAYLRKGLPLQARNSYEQFLRIWKNADSDNPELVAARSQLAALSLTPPSQPRFQNPPAVF